MKGLVLGKFMPIHKGHMALIDFALERCDKLIILLCYHSGEAINGSLRKFWLEQLYLKNSNIFIHSFEYNPAILSDSSISSIEVSQLWGIKIKKLFPEVNVIFSSEQYGDYVADFLGIKHIFYDKPRALFPITSSDIRKSPSKFWKFIPSVVQPYFVKKISILGSESTGKSIMAEKLAHHYHTEFVPEIARKIIGHTKECKYEHLEQIAKLQAKTILQKEQFANKFLFIDTDLNITKSYSKFLFGLDLIVEEWVEKVNQFDLYVFLEIECPYVQDGTRLNEDERNLLNASHKQQLKESKIRYVSIGGSWQERFDHVSNLIEKTFLSA